MDNETKEEIILRYLKDPATSGGRDRLWGHLRIPHPEISRRDVAKVLRQDPIAQQNRPLKKRITTRPSIISDRAKVWGIDLMDFQKLAGYNNGHRYILTCVDLLSRFCSARPIRNKTQANVTAALMDILDSIPDDWQLSTIVSDRGSEFQVGMQRALEARGIKLIHSQAYNPRANGHVERLNRTLKSAIFSLMARHETKKWVQFLEPLVLNLNSTTHESTGYTPIFLMNVEELPHNIIEEIHARSERRRPKNSSKIETFQIGDFVRVAMTTELAIRKQTLRKHVAQNWSPDVFQIYSISSPDAAGAQPQYLLKNMTTQRKSIKKYWSYQMIEVDENAQVEEEDNEEEYGIHEPPIPAVAKVPIAAVEKRIARNRTPSARALENIAH